MMRSQGLLEAREGNLRGPTAETGVPFNAPNGETTSSQTQTLNVADWNVHRRRERPGASARIIRATLGPPKITNHIWCDGAKRLFRSVQGRNQSHIRRLHPGAVRAHSGQSCPAGERRSKSGFPVHL